MVFIDYLFYPYGVFLFLFQVESKNSVLQLQVLNTEIQLKPLINYSWDSISSPAAPEAKGKNTEILLLPFFTLYRIFYFFVHFFRTFSSSCSCSCSYSSFYFIFFPVGVMSFPPLSLSEFDQSDVLSKSRLLCCNTITAINVLSYSYFLYFTVFIILFRFCFLFITDSVHLSFHQF